MKAPFLLPLFVLLFFITSCQKDDNGPGSNPALDPTPAFLRKGWILPVASINARTYDFPQVQAAGRRTVEIRAWQLIGTLGWQSNQIYTADYEATDKQVVMTSASGYQETWDILSVEPTKLLINRDGQQVYIFNCEEPGWPDLIKSSTKGCR